MLFSGSWAKGKEAPSVKVVCLAQQVGTQSGERLRNAWESAERFGPNPEES
jgi:hypothetical protein